MARSKYFMLGQENFKKFATFIKEQNKVPISLTLTPRQLVLYKYRGDLMNKSQIKALIAVTNLAELTVSLVNVIHN